VQGKLSNLLPKLLKGKRCTFGFCCIQRCNEGEQGGRNSPGAESLLGRRITAGALKSPNNVTSTFSGFASERPQVRTWGRQTCFLSRAPSDLVTPLVVLHTSKFLLFERSLSVSVVVVNTRT